jgi:hypothetical protein
MEENELNELKQKIQDILNDGQAKLTEINFIVESSKKKEAEVNAANHRTQEVTNQGQSKLSEITAIADNSKLKETELNTYHSRIIELKGAAENTSNSLTEVYNNAFAVKQQIDGLHRLANDAKNAIDQFNNDTNNKTNEINGYYNSFQELRQKIENPDEGMTALLNKTKDLFGQVANTTAEATNSKEDIVKNKVKSDSIVEETNILKGKVATNYSDSEKLKADIGKILDLVRDTGLANSFDQRRKRSQLSSLIALGVIILGVGISAISIYKVFLTTEGQALFNTIQNDYIKFLLRLTLTAPGVFTAWFGAAQYSRERFFLEQYEFKTAAALALENYTKLLKDNYASKEDDIFKLNIELIKSVYKEPIYVKPRTSFFTRFKVPKTDTEVETKLDNK